MSSNSCDSLQAEPTEVTLLKEYEQALSLNKTAGEATRQHAAMFITICSAVSIAIATRQISHSIILILLLAVAVTGIILSNSLYRNGARSKSYTKRARRIEKRLGMQLVSDSRFATKELKINISNRKLIMSVVIVGSFMTILYGLSIYLSKFSFIVS